MPINTHRVGWDDDPVVTSWPGLGRLESDLTADACVVGLGGSGLAAVAELTDRGLSVVGIDAGRIAAGAAGRNGGFLLAGPSSFLHRSLALWGEAAISLYRATLDELDHLGRLLGEDVIRRTGSLRLAGLPGRVRDDAEAADREAEIADCGKLAATLRDHGIAVEDYEGPLGRGIYLPDDAAMNPVRRALGMASLLRSRAALFENTAAVRIDSGRVTTATGRISAPLILVAVDGRLEQVLPELAGRVRTSRLQMARTEPVATTDLPCPVYCRWGFDYGQQDARGRLYVGGGRDRYIDEEWTLDDTPTPVVQKHIESVAERLAGRPVTVSDRWGASVGFTEDGRPLCTEVAPGVVAFGGYSGTGNLVGPVTARAAVALALDGTPVPGYLNG
ncbi:FAD-binding oxidoreductase [Streptomyces sp. NPDC052077]|uniref:NAD(P)/FAD-dependent oxidoreductase n=1 Tax=Streptomyces sp. NPDC052077 TaxID=3154757 RepID=UPI003433081F